MAEGGVRRADPGDERRAKVRQDRLVRERVVLRLEQRTEAVHVVGDEPEAARILGQHVGADAEPDGRAADEADIRTRQRR